MALEIFVSLFMVFWIAAAVTGFGFALLRKLRLDLEAPALLLSLSAGVGLIAIIILMMTFGWLGLLGRDIALWIMTAFTVVGFLVRTRLAIALRLFWKELSPTLWFEKCLLAVLLIAVLLNMLDCFAPIIGTDARVRYLADPKIYAQAGNLIYNEHSLVAGFPENGEMLYTFGFLLGTESLARLLNWGLGVALALLIGQISSRFLSPKSGYLAAAIFYLTGIHWFYSVESKVDICQAYFALLALGCFLYWLKKQKHRFIVLAGIFCGVAMGTKLTSLTMTVAPLVLLFPICRIVYGASGARFYLRGFVIFCLLAAVLGSPWYIRNIVETGNPVEPQYSYKTDLFPNTKITPYAADIFFKSGVSRTSVKASPIAYPILPIMWTLRDFTQDYRSGESRIGPLFLLLIPLLLLRRNFPKRSLLPIALFLSLGYVVSCSVAPTATRYYYPLFPAAAIIAGFAFYFVSEKMTGRTTLILKLVIGAVLLFQLGSGPVLGNLRSIVGLKMSKDEYLEKRLGAQYKMECYINKNLPVAAKIFLPYDQSRYYCERQLVFGYTKNEAEDAFKFGTDAEDANKHAAEIYQTFKVRGINYIVRPDYERFLSKPNEAPTWFLINKRQIPEFVFFAPENERKFLDLVVDIDNWKLFKLKDKPME